VTTMPSTKNQLPLALILSALFSVGAVATSIFVSGQYTDHAIKQALNEQLPVSISSALDAKEQAKIAAAKEKIWSQWPAAIDAGLNGRHVYGKADAEFTLVEFSDLECPYCKRFHDTPKSLVEQAGGKINWEWQHYPLQFHNPTAAKAAHASECVGEVVGNLAFWAFTGEWFERSALNGQGYDEIERLAQEVGADPAAFSACMESGKYKQKIQDQMDRGTAMGVTGTPATVIVDNTNGRQILVKGAQPAQALLKAMGQLIEQRGQPAQSPIQEKAQ